MMDSLPNEYTLYMLVISLTNAMQRRSDVHVHYALMNIPETENLQHKNWKCCMTRIVTIFGRGGQAQSARHRQA